MNNSIIVVNKRLDELESIIDKHLKAFYKVGSALIEIRESKLYKEDYDTFEDYCRDRWDLSIRYADKLMLSAKTIKVLESTPIGVLPQNESQTRPLTRLSAPLQQEVWQKVVETAPEGKVTARYVSKVVSETRKENVKKEVKEKSKKAASIPKEAIMDQNFKHAFDAFYREVQRTRLENWKTTSKEAALRSVILIKSLIEVK